MVVISFHYLIVSHPVFCFFVCAIQGIPSLVVFIFQTNHKLTISMLSHGVCMLYSSFQQEEKKKERLNMK